MPIYEIAIDIDRDLFLLSWKNLKNRSDGPEQRISIRRCRCDRLCCDRAAGARSVFYDDLLTQSAGQLLPDHARQDIWSTAGW